MAEFINTADVIGDDEMIDQIIMRTVTEYKEDRITEVVQYAFSQCKKLKTIDLPNVTNIHAVAFAKCSELTSVNVPSVTELGISAFQKCSSLERISLPSLVVLRGDNGGWGRFMQCTALKYIDLPVCERIGGVYVFNGSSSLVGVILRKAEAVCALEGTQSFNDTPIASGTGYIYVPRTLIDSYKTATNWSTYANQFRALEDYTVDGTITGELDETKI